MFRSISLLTPLLLLLSTIPPAGAQQLIWESPKGNHFTRNALTPDIIDRSDMTTTEFEKNSAQAPVVTGDDTDNRVFHVITWDEQFRLVLNESWTSENVVFLGFTSAPILDAGDDGFNQLVFGRTEQNRIIAILVGYKLPGSNEIETQELRPVADFRLAGIKDVDNDNKSEIFLYNVENKVMQLWGYSD